MNDVLLAIHFMGLMLGAGGGLGSTIAARYAGTLLPEQVGVVRGLGPWLARMSTVGLVLMLASGIALAFVKWGGFGAMPAEFWIKMVFVTTLTLAAIGIEMSYAQAKAGNAAAAARIPKLGPMAGISSLLAVIFAVLTFH